MAKQNKPPPIIEPPEPDAGRRLPPWTWIVPLIIVTVMAVAAGSVLRSTPQLDYSTFKRAVRAGRVVEVTIGADTVAGRLRWTAALEAPTSSAAAARAAVGDATRTASAGVAGSTPVVAAPVVSASPVASAAQSASPVASAARSATASPKAAEARHPALVEGAEIDFRTVLVHDPQLYADLEAHGVTVRGVTRTDWSLPLLALTLIGLPLLMMSGLSRRMRDAQGGAMSVGKSRAKIAVETDVKISFKDVAGVDEAKAELREVVEYLQTPEKFTRLGGKIPKGVLLVGPPGTGKTLLAKAVAGEAGVPFFFISGSDFVEMFVGVGAARVRDLFAEARKKAPCIIFIDELDALGKARGNGPMAHEEREQTLNQLLVELDGFDGRTGVILLGATNRPEILDPALLRAGRFDRNVLVDRPDKIGRRAILELHAKNVPLADLRDLDELAGLTAGFAGAELANVINEAALLAVRRDKDVVTKDELLEAVERVVAGLEKKNRTLGKKERDIVAHHEVGHALVAMAMPGADPVRKISIIPRGVAALGYTLQMPSEDRFLMTRADLEARIATLLGGRIAEEVVFGEISTGARDDLRKATDLARSMVTLYGMSEAIGRISYERDDRGQGFLGGGGRSGDDASEATRREIDVEIRRIVDAQYERARAILRGEEGALRRAAAVLLEREVISGEELLVVVEEHRRATQGVGLGLSDS